MTTNSKALIASIGVIGLAAAPVITRANEIYFLVGTRHVFRIGPNPYLDVDQRRQTEQQYADDVAAAQDGYNNDVNNNGVDPATASDTLNQRLLDAASYRDFQLSKFYAPDDQILNRHPEMLLEGDGPYQVIGVNVNRSAWSSFMVMAPWPGFVAVGNPYGWVYGRTYNPYAFHAAYVGWHNGWVGSGAPIFVGLYGSSGFINIGFSASINIGLRSRGFAPGPGFRPGSNWHGSVPRAAPRTFAGGHANWAPTGTRPLGFGGARPTTAPRPTTRPIPTARPKPGSFGGTRPNPTLRPTTRPTPAPRPTPGSFGGTRPKPTPRPTTRPTSGSFGGTRPTPTSRPTTRPTPGSFGGARPSARPTSNSRPTSRPAPRPSGARPGGTTKRKPGGG